MYVSTNYDISTDPFSFNTLISDFFFNLILVRISALSGMREAHLKRYFVTYEPEDWSQSLSVAVTSKEIQWSFCWFEMAWKLRYSALSPRPLYSSSLCSDFFGIVVCFTRNLSSACDSSLGFLMLCFISVTLKKSCLMVILPTANIDEQFWFDEGQYSQWFNNTSRSGVM